MAFISKTVADELSAKGRVRSHTDLLCYESGRAVADSAPTPVLRTTENLVAFLKATPSIAYFAGGSGRNFRSFRTAADCQSLKMVQTS
jgi:hypothetical protein